MEEKNYLVLGATGGTGVHATRRLISLGKSVSVVIRSKDKFANLFSKEEQAKIKEIVCHDFSKDILTQNALLCKALGEAAFVLDTLGGRPGENSQAASYESHRDVINFLREKGSKVEHFALLSSNLTCKPCSPVSMILNFFYDYTIGWATLAENHLRKTNLSYSIIRAPRLTDEKATKRIQYTQDNKSGGKLSRENLAIAMINLVDADLKKKITFKLEEHSGKEDLFDTSPLDYSLFKEDDSSSIVRADHFKATSMAVYATFTLLYFLLFCAILRFIY